MKKLNYLIAAVGITGLLLTTPIIYSNHTQSRYENQLYAEVQETVIDIKTAQQLEDIISKNEKVAVDIGATWCGPCQKYAPTFHEVAEEYKEKAVFCKVVIDKIDKKEENTICNKYQVRYIPKTILIKNGKEVHNRVGGMDKNTLTELVDTYLLEKKQQ